MATRRVREHSNDALAEYTRLDTGHSPLQQVALSDTNRQPSIFFVSSADDNFEGTMKTNIVVQANGSILFVPPAIFKSICPFNIASFPFVSARE